MWHIHKRDHCLAIKIDQIFDTCKNKNRDDSQTNYSENKDKQ